MPDGQRSDADLIDPVRALTMVGAQIDNETRVAILRALASSSSQSLSYSSLRNAVGIEDKGLFNYHLGKLLNLFIEKTDGRYELRPVGQLVVETMESGVFGRVDSVDPVSIDSPCGNCGASLEARYEDYRATVGCSACVNELYSILAWPGLLRDYDRDQFPLIVDRHRRIDLAIAISGLCSRCNGQLESEMTTSGDRPRIQHTCTMCRQTSELVPGEQLTLHPLVTGFCYDNGIDVWRTPSWQLDWVRTESSTISATDPLRVQVLFETESETLRLQLDESVSVVEITKQRRPPRT